MKIYPKTDATRIEETETGTVAIEYGGDAVAMLKGVVAAMTDADWRKLGI